LSWVPHILEEYRSQLRTVEIAVAEELPRVTLDLPAKGVVSGAKRKAGKWTGNWLFATGEVLKAGRGDGAALATTTAGGMLTVIPVVATTGGLYGAMEASPAEIVESQEKQVQGVLQGERMIQVLEQQMHAHLTNRTDMVPVMLPRSGTSQAEKGTTDAGTKPDARLSIVLNSVELRGPHDVDPPLALHLEAQVALLDLRQTPPFLVYSRTFHYASEARYLTEWTVNEAAPFRKAVEFNLDQLVELVVDDLFLIHPFPYEHQPQVSDGK
jgi:hypothetical protein